MPTELELGVYRDFLPILRNSKLQGIEVALGKFANRTTRLAGILRPPHLEGNLKVHERESYDHECNEMYNSMEECLKAFLEYLDKSVYFVQHEDGQHTYHKEVIQKFQVCYVNVVSNNSAQVFKTKLTALRRFRNWYESDCKSSKPRQGWPSLVEGNLADLLSWFKELVLAFTEAFIITVEFECQNWKLAHAPDAIDTNAEKESRARGTRVTASDITNGVTTLMGIASSSNKQSSEKSERKGVCAECSSTAQTGSSTSWENPVRGTCQPHQQSSSQPTEETSMKDEVLPTSLKDRSVASPQTNAQRTITGKVPTASLSGGTPISKTKTGCKESGCADRIRTLTLQQDNATSLLHETEETLISALEELQKMQTALADKEKELSENKDALAEAHEIIANYEEEANTMRADLRKAIEEEV